MSSGVAFTIEPGVIVSFDSNTGLQIEGTLIAIGTDTDNIIFTSNQAEPGAGDWGYIFFTDSSMDAAYDADGNYTDGSILEYCVVEYAGNSILDDNGALRMDNAHPFINYCTIRDNDSAGINAFNLSEIIKISNSDFSNNTGSVFKYETGPIVYEYGGGGISIRGGDAVISNNTISNNSNNYVGYSDCSGGILIVDGIAAGILDNNISNNDSGGMCVIRTDAVISGNTVDNNSYYGVNVIGGSEISGNTISNNGNRGVIASGIISYNTISSNGGGISTVGSATISNNTISDNDAESLGGGIYIGWGSSIVSISNNIISNNIANIYVGSSLLDGTYSNSGGGIYLSTGEAAISNNIITNNIATGDGGGIYVGEFGSATITNNSITGNSAVTASAVYYFTTDNPDFTYNTITDNTATGALSTCTVLIGGNPRFNYNDIFNNTATYKLCNNNAVGTPNVDAGNNWWGTSIESEIQASIYDWFVDISKGIVDYYPYLLSPDAEPEPNISADIESWDFGNIDVGDSANRIFIISNIGTADLAIGDLSLAGNNPYQFDIQNDNCSGSAIAPLGSCTFEAVFSPAKGGALSALIGVNSNDPDTSALYINLSGIGILQTFTVKAVAGANGSISPSGDTLVDYGEDQTFTITPASGYQVADVLVDYVSVGPLTTYTFSSITSSHTIIATFAEECKSKSKR